MVGSQKLISHLRWPFFFVLRSKSQHIVGQQVSSALIGHDFGTLKMHVLGGALAHCWWECKCVQPLRKTVRGFLKKLEMDLPCDPATALLDIYPKETKTAICEDLCPLRHGSTIYISQVTEAT